jgi:hypothetical protein
MTKSTLANGVCPMLHAFKNDTGIEEQAPRIWGEGKNEHQLS